MPSSVAMVPPAIAKILDPRERLLWWDRPKRGLVLRAQDLFMVPFSLIWTGVPLLMLSTAGKTTNLLFILMPSVFVVVGIYFVIGRFFHDMWRRSRLVYGVTDRRVLIVSPSRIKSMDMESLAEMEFRPPRGGYGSISFGPIPGIFAQSNPGAWSGSPAVPTFEFIRDPDRVVALIRDTRQRLKDAG